MNKNKFVKFLKMLVVLFPMFFGFVAKPLALLGYSNGYALNQFTENDVNNIYFTNLEDKAEKEVQNIAEQILSPYLTVIMLNGLSDIPIAYQLAEFTTSTFFGTTLTGMLNTIGDYYSHALCFGLLLVFIWYIFVELIFFIPEIILLFIRWCRNIIYSFTNKGGADL